MGVENAGAFSPEELVGMYGHMIEIPFVSNTPPISQRIFKFLQDWLGPEPHVVKPNDILQRDGLRVEVDPRDLPQGPAWGSPSLGVQVASQGGGNSVKFKRGEIPQNPSVVPAQKV